MKLAIRTRHLILTPQTRGEMQTRLATILARVSPWIRAVDVTVSDINGPKGGPDKHCRLRIRGHSIPNLVIEHVGTDALATIALAAERAQHALIRKMARRRTFAPMFAY